MERGKERNRGGREGERIQKEKEEETKNRKALFVSSFQCCAFDGKKGRKGREGKEGKRRENDS